MAKYTITSFYFDECCLDGLLLEDEITEEEAQETIIENYNKITDKSERIHLLKSLWQHEYYKNEKFEKFNFKEEFKKFTPEELIVLPTEKKFYDSLPDTLTVYRGGHNENGLSWTTNKRAAYSFIKGEGANIFEKTINKKDIYAIINFEDDQYNESEIILIF